MALTFCLESDVLEIGVLIASRIVLEDIGIAPVEAERGRALLDIVSPKLLTEFS
ncbi:hypothetical protein HK44_017300 [Pseudomonas fluorescens HK44]|uniref:Uncharacterized protein n=1 Tax=Pseudomonas fluorescens HK44 TaxID=1042209 RepID=A0A010SK47_PSEFL|nr:hypothetical protein HK44_017300 [Pseudomonas fluorescens HK44]